MIGDRDLLAFRQGYYDLFVSLLWKEPRAELVTGLAEGIEQRIQAAENLHPLLAEGWKEIERFLRSAEPGRVGEMITDEYTRIFIGPHDPQLYPYESYYLGGRLLDRPLVAVRGFLEEVGIQKEAGYAEPEDFLAFELEVVRRLIRRQAAARDPDGEAISVNLQARFLKQHLLVWGPSAAEDLTGARGALFYRGVGKLLRGFFELERDLVRRWGPEPIRSLEEARRSSPAAAWKGPLFQVEGDTSSGEETEKAEGREP
jgi:TorA maturation chaperone TorD